MNKYNEFFAYIENKRMREARLDQVLTLADFNFFKNRSGDEVVSSLYSLNFYRALYNFKKFIELVNRDIMYNWKEFKFEKPNIIEDNTLALYAKQKNPPEISLKATNAFLNPLPDNAFAAISTESKYKNAGELKSRKILFPVGVEDSTSKDKKSRKKLEKNYVFEISNIRNQNGIPYAFLLYKTDFQESDLYNIFIPSNETTIDNDFMDGSQDGDINNLNGVEFFNKVKERRADIANNIKNTLPSNNINNNQNNININSSGMNEIQAKASADIIHIFLNKLLKENIFKNLYSKLFIGVGKDNNNNSLINLNLSNIASSTKPNLLYLGAKPIKLEEAESLRINSQGSKNFGSELVECYFNLFLNGPDSNDIKNLIGLMNKKSRSKTINKNYPTFEIFCKKLYGELINQLQNNKTTINDNNIIYTLGFKQGNYFKMENPLSCKFSIIVGKDVGKISFAGNVAQYLSNQSVANNSRNPRRSVNLKNNY